MKNFKPNAADVQSEMIEKESIKSAQQSWKKKKIRYNRAGQMRPSRKVFGVLGHLNTFSNTI